MILSHDLIGGKGAAQRVEPLIERSRYGGLSIVLAFVLFPEQLGVRGSIEIMVEHGGAASTRPVDPVLHSRMDTNRRPIGTPLRRKFCDISCLKKRWQHFPKVIAQYLVVVAHERG